VPIPIRLHLSRRDPPLENAAERREMGFEDPLGLALREAALELTAAVDALEVQGAKLGHIRTVHADAVDVLSGLEERRQQADGIQDLECARLDRRGAPRGADAPPARRAARPRRGGRARLRRTARRDRRR
jgi:hypothetical protein